MDCTACTHRLWLMFLFGDLHVLQCLGKPLLDCPGGNLGTRRKPEPGEDMADMGLHGADPNDQFVCNSAIGFALSDEACHLALTGGQPAELLLERTTWRKRWGWRGRQGIRENEEKNQHRIWTGWGGIRRRSSIDCIGTDRDQSAGQKK